MERPALGTTLEQERAAGEELGWAMGWTMGWVMGWTIGWTMGWVMAILWVSERWGRGVWGSTRCGSECG